MIIMCSKFDLASGLVYLCSSIKLQCKCQHFSLMGRFFSGFFCSFDFATFRGLIGILGWSAGLVGSAGLASWVAGSPINTLISI